MYHLSIDIETYSSVNLKKSGMHKYVQSPDFEILLLAYSWGDETSIIDFTAGGADSDEMHTIKTALTDPSIIKHAYNAAFEWYCLSRWLKMTVQQSYSWLSHWRCTMLHGLYCGYTAGLEATGVALGLPEDKKKLGAGASLIRTFCAPVKPTRANGCKTRILPRDEPEKWELFKSYCIQDVVTEIEIERRLSPFPVPTGEQKLWELDLRINSTGIKADTELINGALLISDVSTNDLMSAATELSGLKNPKSVPQLTKWINKGLEGEIENLQKDTVSKLIENTDNETVVKMLKIRQELSKTSVKKYTAMSNCVCEDGRIRGLLQFYGANRTGRWAGRLVQMQNLPRNEMTTLSFARKLALSRNINMIRFVYGNVPDVLSQLVRTAFIPSPGRKLIVADFSAIEARILAWLAGEDWRLDVFKTHGKIYEASASAMFGTPVERIRKGYPEYELRQKGKVAELALGYQGGVGALKQMGALDKGLTDDELPEIVRKWRGANKRIVDLWYQLESAAISVMTTALPCGVKDLLINRESDLATGQHFLTVQLPSGRKLFYVKPFLSYNNWGGDCVYYYGMDQKTKKWAVMDTYGGKLTENIVQAIARDCLAESLLKLDAAGYETVMHVHDEVVIDAPREEKMEDVCRIMSQPIPWAKGLVLKADGFESDYYKKE